jgi:hypothetical protein
MTSTLSNAHGITGGSGIIFGAEGSTLPGAANGTSHGSSFGR